MQRSGITEQTVTFPWQATVPDAERIRVTIRPMSTAKRQAQQDAMIEDRTTRKGTRRLYRIAQLETESLTDHIVRVDGITDLVGKPKAWPGAGADLASRIAYLDNFEPRELTYLVNAIRRQAELNEEEEGNSATPSGSPSPGGGSETVGPNGGSTATA